MREPVPGTGLSGLPRAVKLLMFAALYSGYLFCIWPNATNTALAADIWAREPEEFRPPAEIREKGRGRIAHRVLRTRTALNTSLAVPPVPPAFPLERTTTVVKIGAIRSAIVAGVTNRDPERTAPADLLVAAYPSMGPSGIGPGGLIVRTHAEDQPPNGGSIDARRDNPRQCRMLGHVARGHRPLAISLLCPHAAIC